MKRLVYYMYYLPPGCHDIVAGAPNQWHIHHGLRDALVDRAAVVANEVNNIGIVLTLQSQNAINVDKMILGCQILNPINQHGSNQQEGLHCMLLTVVRTINYVVGDPHSDIVVSPFIPTIKD